MGMFDTIMAELECPQCGKTGVQEIQTHRGPCLMELYYTGDTIEPFYFGDYQFEEEWYCRDCYRASREKGEKAKPYWHKAYVHCMNGMIVEVSNNKAEVETFPDWPLIHQISRDRHNYRSTLLKIDNMIHSFLRRKKEETPLPFDIGPKNMDELLDNIRENIAGALKGESPGMF